MLLIKYTFNGKSRSTKIKNSLIRKQVKDIHHTDKSGVNYKSIAKNFTKQNVTKVIKRHVLPDLN